MLNVHTSVLARRVRIESDYATLPLEAGWASEAVFFVQVERDHAGLEITTEVSPDGISWIARGAPTRIEPGSALAEAQLTVFGNWLRLAVTGASVERPARVLIHVALKG